MCVRKQTAALLRKAYNALTDARLRKMGNVYVSKYSKYWHTKSVLSCSLTRTLLSRHNISLQSLHEAVDQVHRD